ncbi:MAG: hypothetical protein K0M70_02610 [Arenimonas sp.]|uniref:hypothetical protein n=1 Tax=Arenimonas sp. TaxID=1872635 RepID=UPI0025C07D64|nr:hypothetical protein [Arenimonas sp.]MBW8366732.1 hypothetical protein [Arenimonas sp.]
MSLSDIEETPFVQTCLHYWNSKEMIGLPTLTGGDAVDNCSCVFLWGVAQREPTLSAEDYEKKDWDPVKMFCLDGKLPPSARIISGLEERQASIGPRAERDRQEAIVRDAAAVVARMSIADLERATLASLEKDQWCTPAGDNHVEYLHELVKRNVPNAEKVLASHVPRVLDALREAIIFQDAAEARRLVKLLPSNLAPKETDELVAISESQNPDAPVPSRKRIAYCMGE